MADDHHANDISTITPSLTTHFIETFSGGALHSRPHITGYSGYCPSVNITGDVPGQVTLPVSRVGQRLRPGDNPVKLGMDKIRAFRSIPGYAGHVPSPESYLSKGVRKNGLDIPRALRSLLDEGVEEEKLKIVLDKNGTGWLDKDKVLAGMMDLGFSRIRYEDVDSLFEENSMLVGKNEQMAMSRLMAYVNAIPSPSNAAASLKLTASGGREAADLQFGMFTRKPSAEADHSNRAGYVSPYEPKKAQGYRFPLRNDFINLQTSNFFAIGKIPGYTGHVPLVRPYNKDIGGFAVGRTFAEQSRVSQIAANNIIDNNTSPSSKLKKERTIAGMMAEPERMSISREKRIQKEINVADFSRTGAISAPP